LKLALHSPRARSRWWAGVLARLSREATCAVVAGEGDVAEGVPVYDVADDPAHGFVYRALLRRPGLVVLEDWSLHRLVRAETAGRGDAAAYRREARLCLGETGSFVAEQVLAGRGGALPALLPWNERVLAAALALATTREAVRGRAAHRLGERPVRLLAGDDAEAAGGELLALAAEVDRDGERLQRAAGADRAPEGTLLGLLLDELRPAALALGLPAVPQDAREAAAGLVPEGR
jgi:hypothetical protein